jgi:glucokinase
MSYYLGLDIGATKIRCALATDQRERIARVTHPTPQGPTVEAFVGGVETAITDTLDDAGVTPARVDAAGVASFGPLDAEAGLIRETVNLDSDLENVPVRATVETILPDAPVRLCNDAIAGVIAEYREGVGEQAENIAYVTLSSGIGAGVVVDGHVLRGADGNAAEVGHVTLDPEAARSCGCGGRGHWEAFAGGENIPEYAADLADSAGLDDGLLAGECTAATIFGAYGEDPLATETVDRVGDWNAQGMATLVQAFAPRRIAVGGAVARNNERLVLEPIRERIGRHLTGDAPEIRLTEFGDRVVLRGALLLAAGEGRPGTALDAGAGGKRADF